MLNANGGEAINPVTGNFRKGWSRPAADGKPYPDVLVHFRLAAYLAAWARSAGARFSSRRSSGRASASPSC
jgi:hypothetical protein